MFRKWLPLCWTCWILLIYLIGILLFTKGFLLKRFVIANHSTCNLNFSGDDDNNIRDGCWTEPRYQRAIVIIIDALRYDFVAKNASISLGEELPYQNKLKCLTEALEDEPRSSRLFKFLADPPTTTLQRLKGLTTGSLPTFVDAGSNFDSSAITEDNIIEQFVNRGKRIAFMGDDTWSSLYPDKFFKEFSYPSFNVKDLHTVDNGVIEHLAPELEGNQWHMLIAHFLGVDHCGHRYGPNHPAMAEKLSQMDEVLRSVMQHMEDDTVLFVLGDHGMTRTGDHGGDSTEELEAALFVYSPRQVFASPDSKEDDIGVVSQIDFVPTFSLLLGLPIPFSNLGTVIPDLFSSWPSDGGARGQLHHWLKALRLNAVQVHTYLHSYSQHSEDFPHAEFVRHSMLFDVCERRHRQLLGEKTSTASEMGELKELAQQYQRYLTGVKTMCQNIWAKFDLANMTLGLALVALALLLNILSYAPILPQKYTTNIFLLFLGSTWMVLLIACLYLLNRKLEHILMGLVTGVSMPLIIVVYVIYTGRLEQRGLDLKRIGEIDLASAGAVTVLLMYILSLFSNSYVVYEDVVTSFFFQTLVWILFYSLCRKIFWMKTPDQETGVESRTQIWGNSIKSLLTSSTIRAWCISMSVCMCVRLAANFRACRAEQWDCEEAQIAQSLSAMTNESVCYKCSRYVLSAMAVTVLPLVLCRTLRNGGNLIIPYARAIVLVSVTSCGSQWLYWALQALWDTATLREKTFTPVLVLPRLIYACVIFSLAWGILRPLWIWSLPADAQSDVWAGSWTSLRETGERYPVSHQLTGGSENKKGLSVLGLPTVYSASVLVLLAGVCTLLVLLVGDAFAPSLTLQLTSGFLFLRLHAGTVSTSSPNRCHGIDDRVTLGSIVAWGLLASEHFFSLGHQATVTTIHWQSAFHGFDGDFNSYILPIALITMNTFASYIVCAVALPLLLLWPLQRGQNQDGASRPGTTEGEFQLHSDKRGFSLRINSLILGYILFHGLKLLAAMCCAGLHRRHLMVWKIFAPRFVFEGATFLVASLVCVLMNLFMMRVDHCLAKWIKKHVDQKSL